MSNYLSLEQRTKIPQLCVRRARSDGAFTHYPDDLLDTEWSSCVMSVTLVSSW